MSKSPKRFLEFNFTDGTKRRIELKRVTGLKKEIDKVCLHLDKIDDGYLLIVNENFWDTEKEKLDHIKVIREE